MTENDIIKALEQHIESTKNIKYGARKKTLVDAELLKDILDLINRQQAEIEKLKEASEEAVSCFHRMESLYNIKCMELKVAKAEAVKEFAERLKEKAVDVGICDAQGNGYGGATVILIGDIDNLVKEMVGETDV